MKMKKLMMFVSAIAMGGCLSVTLSSCVGVNSDVTDNLVSRGDGSKISNNVTFKNLVENSLASETGTSAFKKKIVDDLLYSWYKKNIAELENKDKWAELEKEINDAYDKKIDTYKSDHKGNWEYYFQNEVLDPVGGTENLYKKSEMAAKARATFTSNVFNFTKYLGIRDGNKDDLGILSEVDVLTTEKLLKSENWKFLDFFAKVPGSKYRGGSDKKYIFPAQWARVQKTAFEAYSKKNNPTSISMALWKYGDPVGGIESVYNKNTLTGVDLKSSFTFPAFSSTDAGSGGDKGTEQVFADFVKRFKTTSGFEVDNGTKKAGLVNIPKQYTEDSETQILVNAKHLFDDKASGSSGLEAVFAGATGEMIYNGMNAQTNANFRDYDITSYVEGTTSLFDIFFNQGETTTTPPVPNKSLSFDDVYPGKNIITNKKNDLFNEKNKYSGAVAANVVTSGCTTVKIMIGSEATNCYLTRDEFGVHFIKIDGEKYLADTDSTMHGAAWSQDRRNDVLKAKSLLYRENSNEYSKVEIDTAIKSYFDSNTDDIILDLALEDYATPTDKQGDTFIFSDVKEILGDNINSLKAFLKYDVDGKELKAKVKNTRNGSQKLLAWGNTYSKNFSTTNITTPKLDRKQYSNGLATPLQFTLKPGGRTNFNIDQNSNLLETGNDLYTAALLQAANEAGATAGITITGKMIADAEINKSKEATKIAEGFEPEIVKTGTRQWSENILGNGKGVFVNAINMAILAFSKDGNNLANGEKISALNKYIDAATFGNAYDDAIARIYNSKKLMSKTDGLSKYFAGINPWAVGDNVNQYLGLLKQENSIENFTNNFSKNYSDDTVADLTFRATMRYLIGENGSVVNKNLIDYLRSVITWDNPGAVVWLRKDNSSLNTSFETAADLSKTNIGSIYGWSSNYLGTSSIYQGAQITANTPTSGFAEYSEYWTPCPHVVANTPAESFNLMGFAGLQTANSSNLPSVLSEAIFTNPIKYGSDDSAAGMTKAFGVLSRYKNAEELCNRVSGADARSIRDLAAKVKNLCQISEIQIWAEEISREVYQSGDTDCPTPDDVGKPIPTGVVSARFNKIKDATQDLNKKLVAVHAFEKIDAVSTTANAKYFEPRNPADSSSHVIPEKDKAYSGYRATYYQLNHADLEGDNYGTITTNLEKMLGGAEVLRSIVVQYAQDVSIQSKAIAAVIKKAYDGNKVTVYTRSMNDELGQSWVSDWKKKP